MIQNQKPTPGDKGSEKSGPPSISLKDDAYLLYGVL